MEYQRLGAWLPRKNRVGRGNTDCSTSSNASAPAALRRQMTLRHWTCQRGFATPRKRSGTTSQGHGQGKPSYDAGIADARVLVELGTSNFQVRHERRVNRDASHSAATDVEDSCSPKPNCWMMGLPDGWSCSPTTRSTTSRRRIAVDASARQQPVLCRRRPASGSASGSSA